MSLPPTNRVRRHGNSPYGICEPFSTLDSKQPFTNGIMRIGKLERLERAIEVNVEDRAKVREAPEHFVRDGSGVWSLGWYSTCWRDSRGRSECFCSRSCARRTFLGDFTTQFVPHYTYALEFYAAGRSLDELGDPPEFLVVDLVRGDICPW